MNKLIVIVLCCALVLTSVFLLGMGMSPQGQGQRGNGPMGQGQMSPGQGQMFNQGMQGFGNQSNTQQSGAKKLVWLISAIIRLTIAIIGLVYLAKIARSLDTISHNLPTQKT